MERMCWHRGLLEELAVDQHLEDELPRDGLFRPIYCKLANPPQYVSELINANGQWNLQQLRALFAPMDRDLIYNIPLCTRRQEDCWAWHYEKKGFFTVRSAHQMFIHNWERRTAWMENWASSSTYKAAEQEWTTNSMEGQSSVESPKFFMEAGPSLPTNCRRIGTWQTQVFVHCVGLRIPGSTL
jgi:hypothetical protein